MNDNLRIGQLRQFKNSKEFVIIEALTSKTVRFVSVSGKFMGQSVGYSVWLFLSETDVVDECKDS